MTNSKPGSAWEKWRKAGEHWRTWNPDATADEADAAACHYACNRPLYGPTPAATIRKAFAEGAALPILRTY